MNVIKDPWMFVEYLDGSVKQISVLQAFKDSKIIKGLSVPEFHNFKAIIYNVPVMQFLRTIVTAAYYKPENNFEAGSSKSFVKNLHKNGLDIDRIVEYLNEWEDRFNLFDENHPFLQDIRLKTDVVDDKYSYVSKTNLLAPAGNNHLFEHNKSTALNITQFNPTPDELVYILLYTSHMATSPMFVCYPHKALSANATLFMMCNGDNLHDCIINNCVANPQADRDDDLYDKPVWELDSIDEIKDYDFENLAKNILLCTFFPSLPIYVVQQEGVVKNIVLSNDIKQGIIDKAAREELSKAFVDYNPLAIRGVYPDKDTKEDVVKYKEWSPSIKIVALCLDITKKLTDNMFGCTLLDNADLVQKDTNYTVYYRQYDGMKTNVLSFGKYEIPKSIFDTLNVEDYRNLTEEFQNIVVKILKNYTLFNTLLSTDVISSLRTDFSAYTENYFFHTFIPNIKNEDIMETTIDDFINKAKSSIKSIGSVSNDPLTFAKSYKSFCGSLSKLKEVKSNVR